MSAKNLSSRARFNSTKLVMEAVHWFLKASCCQDVVGLVSWGLAGVPGRSRESRDGSDRGPARLREGQVTHLAHQGQTAPFPLFGVGRRLVSVSLARSPSPLGRSVIVSLIEREEKTVPFSHGTQNVKRNLSCTQI